MTDNKKIMNDEKLEQVAGGGRPNPFRDYTVKDDKEIKEPIDGLVKEIMKNRVNRDVKHPVFDPELFKDKSWEIQAAMKDK